MAECLPSMHEALNSIPGTTKIKRKKEKVNNPYAELGYITHTDKTKTKNAHTHTHKTGTLLTAAVLDF